MSELWPQVRYIFLIRKQKEIEIWLVKSSSKTRVAHYKLYTYFCIPATRILWAALFYKCSAIVSRFFWHNLVIGRCNFHTVAALAYDGCAEWAAEGEGGVRVGVLLHPGVPHHRAHAAHHPRLLPHPRHPPVYISTIRDKSKSFFNNLFCERLLTNP